MKPLWETSLKIRAFDVDANNRLKVSTIFDYFQDAASNHAEELKVGYTDLIPKGYFWVLSWAKLEIINYPKFMDEIKIQTWGKKQFKLYSIRDFFMMDENDKLLCKATTAWLFLDVNSMRPKIMPQLFPDVKFLEDKSAIDELPKKIETTLTAEIIYLKDIKYSDIDLNKHANNAKYVELINDCYDHEFHKTNQMKNLTTSFISEAKFGDTLEISKGKKSDIHFIEVKNINSDKLVFQAFAEWENTK
jgi:acyl-ACP thioesterase